MKRVINYLKNQLDWLDDHKNSKLAKNMENANSEIRAYEKAIKILEESERQESAEHSNKHKTKALHIADVSGRVPNEIKDFLHRLRFAEHKEIKKDSIILFNKYCR